MNQEIKKQWIEALTSGKYEQTTCYLKDNKGFCCLGVLCDIHSKETGEEWTKRVGSLSFKYIDSMQDLSPKVSTWAGVCIIPNVKYKGKGWDLSDLNDLEQLDFEELAELIEDQL